LRKITGGWVPGGSAPRYLFGLTASASAPPALTPNTSSARSVSSMSSSSSHLESIRDGSPCLQHFTISYFLHRRRGRGGRDVKSRAASLSAYSMLQFCPSPDSTSPSLSHSTPPTFSLLSNWNAQQTLSPVWVASIKMFGESRGPYVRPLNFNIGESRTIKVQPEASAHVDSRWTTHLLRSLPAGLTPVPSSGTFSFHNLRVLQCRLLQTTAPNSSSKVHDQQLNSSPNHSPRRPRHAPPDLGRTEVTELVEKISEMPAGQSVDEVLRISGFLQWRDSTKIQVLRQLRRKGKAVRCLDLGRWLLDYQGGDAIQADSNALGKSPQAGVREEVLHCLLGACEDLGRWKDAVELTEGWAVSKCRKGEGREIADGKQEGGGGGGDCNKGTGEDKPAHALSGESVDRMLAVLQRSGQWQQALHSFTHLCLKDGSIPAWPSSFARVVWMLGRARQWQPALQVYHAYIDTLSQRPRASSVSPSVSSAIISALGRGGQWEAALQVFQDLLQRGDSIDRVIVGALVEGLASGGRWQEAEWIVKEMHNQAGVGPLDTGTFHSLMRAYGTVGRSAAAEACMQANIPQPGLRTFNLLISACRNSGDLPRAQAALQEMGRRGISPDACTFATLFQVCGAAGDLDAAFELLAEMHRGSVAVSLRTHTVLLSICNQAGQWDRALQIYDMMVSSSDAYPLDLVAWTAAVRAAGRAGQGALVLQMVQKMKHGGVVPDTTFFNTLVDVCTESSHLEEALVAINSKGICNI